MKNKILLIGGASFIGSEFIKKFKNQYKIFADKSKFRNKKLNLSFKISETKKINDIVKKNDISIIIHLASSIYAYSNLNDFKNEKKKLINPTVKLIRSLNDNIKFKNQHPEFRRLDLIEQQILFNSRLCASIF